MSYAGSGTGRKELSFVGWNVDSLQRTANQTADDKPRDLCTVGKHAEQTVAY